VQQLVLASDLSRSEGSSVRLSLGADWLFTPLMALRLGVNETEITAGFGVNLGSFGLDYAFGYPHATQDSQNFGGFHRFGLHLAFGKSANEPSGFAWRPKDKTSEETAVAALPAVSTITSISSRPVSLAAKATADGSDLGALS